MALTFDDGPHPEGTPAILELLPQAQLHRPPYGIYSAAGLTAAQAAGMKPLLWSRWGKDWRKFTTPQRIANRVTRQLAPGEVILLHDGDFYSAKRSHRKTAKALELIFAELDRRGLGTTVPRASQLKSSPRATSRGGRHWRPSQRPSH